MLLDPHVRFYGRPTLDSRMFIPPWYPLIAVWYEPTNKLSYQKLQYPTYVKDIDLDVHIKVFKKIIIVNGEIVEANIINMFGFTLWNCISEWGKNFVQNHPNCISEKSWNKCFANAFELWRTMKKSTCGQGTSNNKLANKWKFIMNICSNLLIVCK